MRLRSQRTPGEARLLCCTTDRADRKCRCSCTSVSCRRAPGRDRANQEPYVLAVLDCFVRTPPEEDGEAELAVVGPPLIAGLTDQLRPDPVRLCVCRWARLERTL